MPATPNERRPLTISIVSHGQLPLILPLLDQLEAFSAPLIEQVVLTHNIPEPDLLRDRSWSFALTRIDNAQPLGFGANNNQAFGRCASPWFLVLNPDIRFDSDILAPLLAQARPQAGLLTPRILEPGRAAPEPHRGMLTPFEILGRKRVGHVPPAAPAWVPGLFMLLRAQAYAEIRGFDERFFMYGEDFDLCARLVLAGWSLQVADGLRAHHEAQRASHRSRRHLYWHVSSLLKVWSSRAFWRYWWRWRSPLPPAH